MLESQYLNTFGKAKHAQIFMEKVSVLEKNKLNYTLKVVNQFNSFVDLVFSMHGLIKNHTNASPKLYFANLIYKDCYERACKYLTEKDQRTYLRNLMVTKLKKLTSSKISI